MSFLAEQAAPETLFPSGAQRGSRGSRAALRYALFPLLPVFLLLGFSPAPAQITVEAKVGFHGVFQLGRPFPLEITVTNGGRPAEGILEVQVWKSAAFRGGVPYATFHRRELFVPARSRRAVQFTIDPDFLSRPLRIQFSGASASVAREIDLRRYFSPTPLVLLLSEGQPLPLAAFAAASQRVVAVSLAELPAEARALLGVSHLVLYEQSLRDLTRAQSLALDGWLGAGGRMVIVGSLNFALYQEPQLARYLPVRVGGARRITFTPPTEAGQAAPVREVWAQSATVLRGKKLMAAGDLPVLVESSWGKGNVVYFALDAGRPPLAGWKGLGKFLQSLLAPAVEAGPAQRPQWTEAIFSQILLSPSFVSAYIPTASLFLTMAVYLAGIFCLQWLAQRRRMRWRKLALLCVAWIFISAAAGFLVFSRGGQIPDGVLLAATLLEDAGEGYVEAQTNLALFSTQPRDYTVAFARGWLELSALGATRPGMGSDTLVYRYNGGATRVELPLKEWGYRLLRARYLQRMSLRATIEPQLDRVSLDVRNQSGHDLIDCWLLAPGARIALGPLPKGESWKKSFPLEARAADNSRGRVADELNLREVTFNDKTRDILFHSSFFPRDGADASWRGGAALFFGWIKDPESRVDLGDARIRVHNYALYRAIVPLAGAEEE
jgi:hypothetical protein